MGNMYIHHPSLPVIWLFRRQQFGCTEPQACDCSCTACEVLVLVLCISCRGENRSGDSNFLAGFVMGGVVFGALGFLLAPQVRIRGTDPCRDSQL